MVKIYDTEITNARYGGGMYLNPTIGNGMYLNPVGYYRGGRCRKKYNGGFINFSGIANTIGNTVGKVTDFVRANKDVIQTGVDVAGKIGSTIASIKQAVDEGEKLKTMREIAKLAREKRNVELNDAQKEIIRQTVEGVIAKGNGLKRF